MWLRYINVVVTPKNDPSKKRTFSKHQIDFVVRSTIGWPADTADITIYNLALEEVKFLQNKNFGDLYIEIQAGYIDELAVGAVQDRTGTTANANWNNSSAIQVGKGPNTPQTLFSGVITNSVGFKRPPEHITQMFCISKAYGVSTTFLQMNAIEPGATLEEAIKSMANDYGFSIVSSFGVNLDDLQVKLPRGRSFHDTFLIEFRNLLSEHNLNFSLTTGEIQIFPETYGDKDAVDRMAKGRAPVKIDKNYVIGNPIAGICTLSLDTFLNSNVQPGMVLDVSDLVGKDLLANGVVSVSSNIVLNTDQSVFRYAAEDRYVIMEVIHQGSNRTDTFQTSIASVIGGNNAMGSKELAWQDAYKNSGMAWENF